MAIVLSIASLLLWVLTLGVLYKLVDAYRRHVTTIATLNTIIGKQREISQQTISEVQAQAAAAQWAATFKAFPPVQKPNTFTLDDALRMMHETASGMH